MSFPHIPNITPSLHLTRSQVVNLLLTSIAFEELSLAHVINSEAEKLQAAIGTLPGSSVRVNSVPQLLSVNQSVNRTLQTALKTQMLLQFKLENVNDLPPESSTTTPPILIFENTADAVGTFTVTIPDSDQAFYHADSAPAISAYNISGSMIASGISGTGTPAIHILKEVSIDGGMSWTDANNPPGPFLPSGQLPWFRITVTNNGTQTLELVAVTDDKIGPIGNITNFNPGGIFQWVIQSV